MNEENDKLIKEKQQKKIELENKIEINVLDIDEDDFDEILDY